ncbi:MAG: RHS repeat-associated core domain-containing protein [Kiritimatiellia bacterium]
MKTATRLLKATAAIGLCALLPGLLEASVIKQSFSYDAAGRLTGVTVADRADAGEHYRYDASGNIVEKTVNGHTATMTYDKANQLQTRTDASGTTRFVYDKAGRLIEEQRGGRTIASFEYGYLDKVTSVTRDGVETKFHYNARGMLVAKERGGEIIETLGWDGIGLVARGDTVFANEAHVSGGVPLVAVSSDGTHADYFDSDYLGTTTAAYSADGEVDVYQHSSFGQSAELADARFTGKHYDADLGAHVFPFRNYRSGEGRWTSADPAGFPDGPNQHFYAPVPTMGLDPWGLAEWGIRFIGNTTGQELETDNTEIPFRLESLYMAAIGEDVTTGVIGLEASYVMRPEYDPTILNSDFIKLEIDVDSETGELFVSHVDGREKVERQNPKLGLAWNVNAQYTNSNNTALTLGITWKGGYEYTGITGAGLGGVNFNIAAPNSELQTFTSIKIEAYEL